MQTKKIRIPITAITVFGASSLLALVVGIVLFLGFNQAAKSTRQLWADQSDTLIGGMEQSLDFRLRPIREQAQWVAQDIHNITNLAELDDYVFGVLAATPQVAGVAIIKKSGHGRRWLRESRTAINGDWSQQNFVMNWIDQVQQQNRLAWREPILAELSSNTATLLHDTPLHDEAGNFIGVFAQVVPIDGLSSFLSRNYAETGITPFVIYDRNFVLAHPALINGNLSTKREQPLPTIAELGDVILERLWTPDENAPYISKELVDIQASGVTLGSHHYLYLYRTIERYGPGSWTIGAYINTKIVGDDETERLSRALILGCVVLLLAIVASVVVGRKVSNPVKSLGIAADTIGSGNLASVPTLTGSYIRELDEASGAFNNMVKGLKERQLIRQTLGRFVPEEIASSLLAGGGNIQPQQAQATILFCDIESFTQLTETLGPIKIVDVLNAYFSAMVVILEKHNGMVTQFQGDAILAIFNVPVANENHPNDAVAAAVEMLQAVGSNYFADKKLNIRIGINTGAIIAGAIGAEGRLNYTVHGDAVNLAARLESINKEHDTHLLVSGKTASLAHNFEFSKIGETVVRGQTQSIELLTPTKMLLPED